MCHFMTCISYRNEPYSDWSIVNGNNYDKQLEAGTAIEKRFTERTVMMEKQEAGRAQHIDSTAPGNRRAMLQL